MAEPEIKLANWNLGFQFSYKNKIIKIFAPFFVASLLYYMFWERDGLKGASVLGFIKAFTGNEIMGYLWFVYTILGFYLVVPFLVPMLKKMTQKEKRWLAIVLLLMILWKNCSQIFGFANIFSDFPFYNMAFLLFGYLLEEVDFSGWREWLLYALGVIAAIVSCVERVYFEGRNPGLNDNSLTRLFMCFAFFVLISRRTMFLCKPIEKGIQLVAERTYDIYLIHCVGQTIFFNYLWNVWVTFVKLPFVLALFLGSIVIFAISLVLALLIRKLLERISLFMRKKRV